MKNLLRITVLFLLMVTKISYSQVKTLKTSNSSELNATFVPSATITTKDAPIFKDANLNIFYELKKSVPASSKLYYSLDKTDKNGKTFILKTVYDADKTVNSLSISCSDDTLLKSKLLSTTVPENVSNGCTRYNYSLSGCWQALYDYIFN